MPRVSDRHAQGRRRQILDAARKCFARAGFHRTTMQDIFREAGLSPGAVYTWFFGKEEIVRAVAQEVLERDPEDLGHSEARLVVQLWAEALHDPRIMEMVATMPAPARARLLERALRPA
jgi:AcrR family transcriptional regulator